MYGSAVEPSSPEADYWRGKAEDLHEEIIDYKEVAQLSFHHAYLRHDSRRRVGSEDNCKMM